VIYEVQVEVAGNAEDMADAELMQTTKYVFANGDFLAALCHDGNPGRRCECGRVFGLEGNKSEVVHTREGAPPCMGKDTQDTEAPKLPAERSVL
jgi:hypothetical protein